VELLAALALLCAFAYGFHEFVEGKIEIGRKEGRGEVQGLWNKQKSLDEETFRLRSEANQKIVDTALTQGEQREAIIKTLAASSTAASSGLRDTIAAFNRSSATATTQALIERAAAASSLLGDCSDRYRSLAEKADRHANDARTISEAWPQK
jgi:hypothetical protein